jgi:23S rRNA (pseudouridine1915-N3)-methyltransferase
VPAARGVDEARAMRQEGEALLRRISPAEHVWLLERSGSELSTFELVERLGELSRGGVSRLTLVVAGPYGASGTLLERANFLWSLSQLTLLHEWARALVLEQLYRAAKIARREPYHH